MTEKIFPTQIDGGSASPGQVLAWDAGAGWTPTNAPSGGPKSLSFFCGGKPAANEIIASGIVPYPGGLTFSASSTIVRSSVAASSSTTLSIRRNGTQIGTVTFGAGATAGTVSFSSTTVAVNDLITVVAPSAADTALANITGLLSETR